MRTGLSTDGHQLIGWLFNNDVRKLKGRTPPTWRLKEGDWRALFTLDSNAREVEVGDVVRRSHAYDR